MVPWLPPYTESVPPGRSIPLRVVKSMIPAVRSPYSAGSAPVIRLIEEINRGSRDCPKTLIPSGRMIPLRRYCRPLCSPRTWNCPNESWVTSGACITTWLSSVLSPPGVAAIAAASMV